MITQAVGKGFAQSINLKENNITLAEAMRKIQQQSGYAFFLSGEEIGEMKINAKIQNANLKHAMSDLLTPLSLEWSLRGDVIIIKPSPNRLGRQGSASTSPRKKQTQQRQISGRVTDPNNLPLEGVTIAVKGSSLATSTDKDGRYQITLPSDDRVMLVFSILGYQPEEASVGGRTVIDLVLQQSMSDLDEVVVVGYGTQRKRDLTGAISRIDASDFESQAATSVSEFLSGTVAGVSMSQGTSAAGGGVMEIRGRNSLKAGTDPLIVLDGVVYNGALQDINPFDIATIDVLQDASSAAVYGARAASGVIIVTTKRGTSEIPTVTVSAMTGIATTSNDYKPFDGPGYLRFREDLMQQIAPREQQVGFYANPQQLPDGISLDEWRAYSNNPNADNTVEWLQRLNLNATEIEGYQQGRTTDWYDMRMQQGIRHNYDIALSGKAPRVNYYLSTGFTDNEGVVYGDRIKIWRTRMNLEGDVADFLKVGINSQFSSYDGSSVSAGSIDRLSPFGRFADEEGILHWYPHEDPLFSNPFLDAYYRDQHVRNNRLFATLYSELKLPFGFKYRFSFQNRLDIIKDYKFWPTSTIQGGRDRQNGYGTRLDEHGYEWMIDNIITWNKSFGRHGFDFTFLANAEKLQIQRSMQENENFGPNGNLSWHGLQYGINPSINNDDMQRTADALLFRLNYHFNERYLVTVSWRRDGYSAFGQNHPRGFFPSAAVAWRLSEESFFNANWVDDLKLRLSWGVNGNRDVSTYAALADLSRNPYYDGTNVVVGLTNSSMANPNLKWEGTEAYNAGVDLTVFDGRLTVTIDAYRGTTHDLLLDRRLPRIIGYEYVTTNLGKISNSGINASVGGQLLSNQKITWNSNLVFSLNRNQINRLWGDMIEETVDGKTVIREVPDYANRWFPGEAIDRVWDYRLAGIWQVEEADEAEKYGLRPGEYKAVDVNGDGAYGQFTDKQFLGWEEPRYNIGWRNDFKFMKNFDFSVFLRADLGHIGGRSDFNHSNSNTYNRSNTLGIPYWTPENRSNTHPRLNVNHGLFEGGINIYERRSFLRVQDVSLGYRVPLGLIERLSVDHLRVFVTARNLVTLTSWSGWDPESLNSPMPRVFTFGLNASF